jgi:hypothetical protein
MLWATYYFDVIPRIWMVALCALGVSAPGADEPVSFEKLIKLEGQEFVTAADQSGYFQPDKQTYTVDQLIAVAEKLLPTIKPYGARPDDYQLSPFSSYFEEACKNAHNEQLDKLVGLYRRLDPNTFEKSNTLPALASGVLARQLAATASKRLELPEDDGLKLPPELESAPRELQNAWRSLQRAKAAFEKAFPKTTEQIEVSANMKSFYNLIGEALSGATGLEDDIRRFAWTGANCLDISDIDDAQDIALLLMLLREGRTNEAIGAALRVASANGSTSKPEACAKPVIDLFERCGLDWEEIFVGGQVEAEIRRWGNSDRAPYLEALLKYGSARSAPLVRQLAYFVKPEYRSRYVGAFTAWVETSAKTCNCKGTEISMERGRREYSDRTTKPMPPAVQAALIRTTEEFAITDSPEDLASYAINIFRRTQVRASIPALKALVRHRARNIAEDAAVILCAMGEDAELPSIGGPVRFQIFANGQPLPQDTEIDWRIDSENGPISSSANVTADGVVAIPRLHFLIPNRRPLSLKIESFGLRDGGVIFAAKLSPPWNFKEITKVDLKVSSLEISLGNRNGLNAPPPDKAFVGIRRVSDERRDLAPGISEPEPSIFIYSWRGSSLFREVNEMSATPSIRFSAIEEGKYHVWIGVRGAEIWHQTLTVGPRNTKVEAMLSPGSDLRFEIVLPDGQRRNWALLLKDGKEVEALQDTRNCNYHALPYGKYVLRIVGSDADDKYRVDKKLTRGPDEIPYKGRDIPFAVEKGSPALIDLGEIHLEKASGESKNN